jgi:hypothetical protein
MTSRAFDVNPSTPGQPPGPSSPYNSARMIGSGLVPCTRRRRREGCAAPWQVRRAEEFFRERTRAPVTLAETAACVGCSVCSLQLAFRRHRGTTPMAALRHIRLEAARAALARYGPKLSSRRSYRAGAWADGMTGLSSSAEAATGGSLRYGAGADTGGAGGSSSSRSAFASLRSCVSKPSVNQP